MSMHNRGAGTLIRAPGSQFCVCLKSVNHRFSLNIYCGSTDSLDPSHNSGPPPPKQPFPQSFTETQEERRKGCKGYEGGVQGGLEVWRAVSGAGIERGHTLTPHKAYFFMLMFRTSTRCGSISCWTTWPMFSLAGPNSWLEEKQTGRRKKTEHNAREY